MCDIELASTMAGEGRSRIEVRLRCVDVDSKGSIVGSKDAMPPPANGTDAPPEGSHRPRSNQLHDLISIGEIESALSTSISSATESDGDTSLGIRLPLLLRWLTAVQPLATTSPSPKLDKSSESHIAASANSIAPLLEDVAAAHQDAENIEVLVSSLAPSICKEVVGKLPPMSRKKSDSAFLSRQNLVRQNQADCDVWDTNVLDKALHRLSKHEQHKRKREGDQSAVSDSKKQKSTSNDAYLEKMKTVIDVLEQDLKNDDEDMGMEQEEAKKSVETTSATNGRDDTLSSFIERASDDSHISSMRRVLHELILLVKSSLNTNEDEVAASNTDEDGHRDSTQIRGASKSPWISTKPDSILAETDTIISSSGIGGFALPVLISALMQHAPILRYRHVACALCRAAVPQSPTLIMHMAANCPAASSCLLRGCIDAFLCGRKYQSSVQCSSLGEEEDVDEKTVNIIHTSIASAEALASLSRREACNVVRVLRECGNHVMSSLVIKILLDIDEAEAASFIVEILSTSLDTPTIVSSKDINEARRQSITKSRLLPLKQRLIYNKQLQGEKQVPASNLQVDTSPEEILKDQTITEAALRCMSRRIIQQSCTVEEQFCLGNASLYIRSYALLTYFITDRESTLKFGSIFEDATSAIHILSQFIIQTSSKLENQKNESTIDEFYTLLLCATLFTIVQTPASKAVCLTERAEKACLECLQLLLLHPVSMKTTVVAARVASFVKENNTMHLLRFLLQSTVNGVFPVRDEKIVTKSDVCHWLSSRFESGALELVQNKAMSIEYVLYDASVFIEKMSQNDAEQSDGLENNIIQAILNDPDKCRQLVGQSKVCDFIRGSVKWTCRKKAPHIPLVLPLALERLSRKLWSDVGVGKKVSSNFMQFVLQLLYALYFLEEDPASPFGINPRTFPLKESLDFMDRLNHSNIADESNSGALMLQKTLKHYILHHCPDLIKTRERNKWLDRDSENISHQDCPVTPVMVCDAINDCIQKNTTDPTGVRAEKLFLASRSTYPSATVDIATVGSILASSSNRYQPKIVSYVALCKDPLILMQARAAVWKCKGLRRMMIRVLFDLMSANECITMKDSASSSAALRHLTARDTVIFRCILFVCASTSVLTSTHCDMCVSLMRSIASRRRGVIATLVKQGLPQSSVDFLVRFIPESFQDASELMSLLDEKDAIPLVERLVTASTALSICVANSSRGEVTAKNLLSASLDTFVDGFHLVIGPLGLPVSVFRDEENGQDITLMCKEATFQIITTLSRINPRSSLRKDAIAYLTKIANLCKSENAAGGVSGAAALKRTNLLKGIWDRCDSSCKSLGGSLR